jgi:hypothetical protein
MLKLLFLVLFALSGGQLSEQFSRPQQPILPSFTPKGIKKFSNGSNFTSMIIIDKSLYVGAK